MAPPRRRWSSFHLHLPGSHARFLVEHLAPWLAAEAASFRRFFYLRYGEGGLHLRLRFLPHGGRPPDGLRRALEACAEAYLETLGPSLRRLHYRIEEHPYRRGEHYFGDTPASAYAELLNEASSWLALRLLRSVGALDRRRRWLLLVGSLDALLRTSVEGDCDRIRALTESRAFATRILERTGGAPDEWVASHQRTGHALRRAVPRVVSALGDDASARRLAALLRRTRARCPDGRFVATHALHLFANKLGYSVTEEARAFYALAELAGPAVSEAGSGPVEPGLQRGRAP